MRKGIFCLALVVALLLSCPGFIAPPAEAGIDAWTQTSQGMYGGQIWSLAISSNYATDNTIFAGTLGGVFRSTDGGSSWTEVNAGLTNLYVWALAISPNYATDQTIFAGTLGGVFKSLSGGDYWSAMNAGLGNLNIRDLALTPTSPHTLFAGTVGSSVWQYTMGQLPYKTYLPIIMRNY